MDRAVEDASGPDATREIIGEAYRVHGPQLIRHLRSMVRDGDIAEDIAQETFARLWREVNAGRVPRNLPAWLHAVGANLVVSHARHASVVARSAHGLLAGPAADDSPERAAIDAERAAALDRVLSELRPDQRAALLLAATGHDGGEIALAIGRTRLATRALLCRTRSRLRARLIASGIEG